MAASAESPVTDTNDLGSMRVCPERINLDRVLWSPGNPHIDSRRRSQGGGCRDPQPDGSAAESCHGQPPVGQDRRDIRQIHQSHRVLNGPDVDKWNGPKWRQVDSPGAEARLQEDLDITKRTDLYGEFAYDVPQANVFPKGLTTGLKLVTVAGARMP